MEISNAWRRNANRKMGLVRVAWYNMQVTETKTKAIKLRKEGYSYSLISSKLNVPKSTLSNWLSVVPFHPNSEVFAKVGEAKLKSALFKQRLKFESIKNASKLAEKEIGSVSKRDLFMLGIGLYIGEGEKSRENIRITNADPRVLRLAKRWFIEICHARQDNFKVYLHLYPDNDPEKSLNFWSREIGLPFNQFGKIVIDRRKCKSMLKRKKLPHGTAHLKVKCNGDSRLGVNLHRRIMAWIDRCTE